MMTMMSTSICSILSHDVHDFNYTVT